MTTNDEAAQFLLERALKTIDPTIVTDIWDAGDWSDAYPSNVRPVYVRKLRNWLSPDTGLLRVEAVLDDTAENPTNFAVNVPVLGGGSAPVQETRPLYGDQLALMSWTVTLTDFSEANGVRQVSAVGWVPELKGNPGGRGRSPIESPGQVVSAVSAVLGATSGAWNTAMTVDAIEVRNAPTAFRVTVRSSGVLVASSALLAVFSPLANKLVAVNIGTLSAVTAVDGTALGLTFT